MKVINCFWRPAAIAILLVGRLPSSFANTNAPLPTFSSVFERVLQRAKDENENERAFDEHYRYRRTKIKEFRNLAGQLKKREVKTEVHVPTAAPAAPTTTTDPKPVQEKTGAVSDTHSNVRGQQFKKNDFLLNEDLVKRFKFTVAGRELLHGRPALVIDFVPANNHLPARNLKERFINKAAGRVWIDAADYSLVKAELHLTQRVEVGWGLIGAVWKFNYGFERERTADGLWFTHEVHWHLVGREVIINRIVDYRETMSNIRKVK